MLLNVAVAEVEVGTREVPDRSRVCRRFPHPLAEGPQPPTKASEDWLPPYYKAWYEVRVRVIRWAYPTPRIELVGLESRHPTSPGTNVVR